MEALAALFARRSIGRLTAPAPSEADLETILSAGAAAPDHGELRPWLFTVLEGEAKDAFGEVLARAYLARCEAVGADPQQGKLNKERTKLGRAPLVIMVSALHRHSDAIPWVEQRDAAAAAAQNMLLAATALGYGSMWRSGEPAHDPIVKEALGLSEHDAIVGFLYIGTPHEGGAKPPNEPDMTGLVERWQPPAEGDPPDPQDDPVGPAGVA
jgi:nitroreductase